MPFDQVEAALDVELILQHDSAALEQRWQASHPERGGVEQGRGQQRDVGSAQVYVNDDIDRVPGEVPVGEQSAFGTTGGARGVENQGHVIEHNGLAHRFASCECVEVGDVDRAQTRAIGGECVGVLAVPRVVHQQRRARVIEQEAQFGVGQAGVQRHEYRAHLSGAEQGRQETRLVGAQERHPVPVVNSLFDKETRNPVAVRRQLCVGVGVVAVDHGHGLGCPACAASRPGTQSLIKHSAPLSNIARFLGGLALACHG